MTPEAVLKRVPSQVLGNANLLCKATSVHTSREDRAGSVSPGVSFLPAAKRSNSRAHALARGWGAKTPLTAQPEATTLTFPFAKREWERLAEG